MRAPEVYVAGKVATVLYFDKRCDPSRTRISPEWASRFEPLVASGKMVVLMPRQDISPQDRIPLLVAFEDRTELPFTVTALKGEADHQINVFQNAETEQALHWLATDARRNEWLVRKENERLRREQLSADHAFAALLAVGEGQRTRLREAKVTTVYDRGGRVRTRVRAFKGIGKAAVVFQITNGASAGWRLMDARLTVAPSGEGREFALRMDRTEVKPGENGGLVHADAGLRNRRIGDRRVGRSTAWPKTNHPP